MDDVATLASKDRADLFLAAASQLGLTDEIIEKDFWVCWVLRRVFTLKDPPAGLIFKGGTSLSKVYNAIERFSEDVDLSFDRAALGFEGDMDPANIQSRKKRDAALDELSASCQKLVRGPVLHMLRQSFAAALGTSEGWTLTVAEDAEDGQTLLFTYPRATPKGKRIAHGYIADSVRLEFGARSDHWSAESMAVSPYSADTHPKLFKDPKCTVKVLAGERTFWEKATILHMWHHIKEGRPLPSRQSRHYYDLARLADHAIGKAALADPSLLDTVTKHKMVFFQYGWASYETAKVGTLKLLPRNERLKELEADYEKMRAEMFFGTPPSFEKLIATLGALEARINGG